MLSPRRQIEVAVLTLACRLLLAAAKPAVHALGRRLPGPLPVFVPPEVDSADLQDDERALYGCTRWRT